MVEIIFIYDTSSSLKYAIYKFIHKKNSSLQQEDTGALSCDDYDSPYI
jgi:hypothetical protein